MNIGDIPIRLADTAGIRDNADEVEKIGVEKALEYIKGADLCIFVVDGNREFDERDAEIFEFVKEKPYIVVLNKSELPRKAHLPSDMVNVIEVSAKEKTGLSDIEEKVYDMLLGKDFEEDSVMITNQRHKEACIKADTELMMAINALEAGITADIAYVYLENAASYLGEVTGMTVSDEVIGEVFSKFCIGK